jgi:predicted thioesterase
MEKIAKGLTYSLEKIVSQNDTATAYGSGLVEVFATPAMIAFMEETALKSVQPLLDENQTTVGFEVCIKHLKATGVGAKVISKAIVEEFSGRKIVFSVEVTHDNKTIGHGRHIRYIVDKDKFNF